MSRNSQRDSQQLARLIRELLRMNRDSKNGLLKWVAALGVLAAFYLLVVVPIVNEKLGWNLPSVAVEQPRADSPPERRNQPPAERGEQAGRATVEQVDARAIDDILNSHRRAVYTSPAGLRYTPGGREHRLEHLMFHAADQPDRPYSHGVFDTTEPVQLVALVDQAYRQALAGENVETEQEGERTVYEIDMGRRVGYVGGQRGASRRPPHPAARHIRLVIQGKNFITAFPFKN